MLPIDLYLVWSNEHSAWWGPRRRGYVRRIADAGRYSRSEALIIAKDALPGHACRYGVLLEIPVRLADVETMQDDLQHGVHIRHRRGTDGKKPVQPAAA